MSLLTLTLFLTSLCTTLVGAAPTDANILLAKKYAPQFRFQKDEVYFPSTVDYFLSGPLTLKDGNGNPINGAPSPLTAKNLASAAPNSGSGTFLTTDVKANTGGFLRGQNPTNSQPTTYTFIAPKANGVVDLYYWLFYPYNLGKKVPLLGYVGNHVGDWERVTVRTVNGEATSIDYHAHDDKGSGTIPYSQTPKFLPSEPKSLPSTTTTDPTARPVAYVASGSHGVWSSAGTFTYVNAVVFKLQDVTSNDGVYWDTKDALTTISYPDTYSDNLSWLNFKGDWGNKGQTNCWWYFIHKECEIVDGPGGPLRDDVLGAAKAASPSSLLNKMTGPLSQTLASVSDDSSQYKVYVDLASTIGSKFITVEQYCVSQNNTTDASDEEDQGEPSYVSHYASTLFTKGTSDYSFTVAACEDGATVASYAVGLCAVDLSESASLEDDLNDCTFGATRAIRAFSDDPEQVGIVQQVPAVVVHDLDNWEL